MKLLLATLATTNALNLSDIFNPRKNFAPPVVMGDESIMSKKAHGTSEVPVQKNLRWSCSEEIADNSTRARATAPRILCAC